jgi:hypothetical protein
MAANIEGREPLAIEKGAAHAGLRFARLPDAHNIELTRAQSATKGHSCAEPGASFTQSLGVAFNDLLCGLVFESTILLRAFSLFVYGCFCAVMRNLMNLPQEGCEGRVMSVVGNRGIANFIWKCIVREQYRIVAL